MRLLTTFDLLEVMRLRRALQLTCDDERMRDVDDDCDWTDITSLRKQPLSSRAHSTVKAMTIKPLLGNKTLVNPLHRPRRWQASSDQEH